MKLLDLFSGIGGFSLGMENAGFETVAFCEIEPFCRKVLNRHWPNVPIYNNVERLSYEQLAADGIVSDVICGGFPCQDVSIFGKGAGLGGERSGLWFEYFRLICEIQPSYAIVENVAALRFRGIDTLLGNLASIGYDAEWYSIPAAAAGAPHQRNRVWIVAYPKRDDKEPRLARFIHQQLVSIANHRRFRTQGYVCKAFQWFSAFSWWKNGGSVTDVIERSALHTPALCGAGNGIPDRMDRTKALGNAVTPGIPFILGSAIKEFEAARC